MTEGADLLAHKPVSKIRHESGFAYIARTWHPELSAHKLPSSAVVLEDGVPLPGPADALHDDIRQLGSGRYCFWQYAVYFSASDNSDPRSNGRQYAIQYTPSFSRVLVMLVPAPLWRLGTKAVGRIAALVRAAGETSHALTQTAPPKSMELNRMRQVGLNLKRTGARIARRKSALMELIKPAALAWEAFYWLCFNYTFLRGLDFRKLLPWRSSR